MTGRREGREGRNGRTCASLSRLAEEVLRKELDDLVLETETPHYTEALVCLPPRPQCDPCNALYKFHLLLLLLPVVYSRGA